MAEVKLTNITKSFGKQVALDKVSMTIPDGSFVVLLGPTGAGKTTTLRTISGLERPDSGNVEIGGISVLDTTPAQRDVAMVFQQYSLYPHMSVRDNLAFPLRSPILRTPEDVITRKVGEVAEVLRISHKLDNKATALSGGEMQRVSIGRALVRDPAIYLMDEPLSSLDAKHPSQFGRHISLRDARPGRSHDHGHTYWCSRRRQACAVWFTARNL
jgi:multiple sugar transport system ATP-binding protein